MDTGKGIFEIAKNEKELISKQKDYPEHGGIFRVGEILSIRGSLFKIKSINLKSMRLKLLPRKTNLSKDLIKLIDETT